MFSPPCYEAAKGRVATRLYADPIGISSSPPPRRKGSMTQATPCSMCSEPIHEQRLIAAPRTKTCSPACSADRVRSHKRRSAKRRARERRAEREAAGP